MKSLKKTSLIFGLVFSGYNVLLYQAFFFIIHIIRRSAADAITVYSSTGESSPVLTEVVVDLVVSHLRSSLPKRKWGFSEMWSVFSGS